MQVTTIGIDLAKTVFQVHAVDADEKARKARAEALGTCAVSRNANGAMPVSRIWHCQNP